MKNVIEFRIFKIYLPLLGVSQLFVELYMKDENSEFKPSLS